MPPGNPGLYYQGMEQAGQQTAFPPWSLQQQEQERPPWYAQIPAAIGQGIGNFLGSQWGSAAAPRPAQISQMAQMAPATAAPPMPTGFGISTAPPAAPTGFGLAPQAATGALPGIGMWGPAVAGALIGPPSVSGVQNLVQGNKLNVPEKLALAPSTFGGSLFAGAFGGSQDPETLARRDLIGRLQKTPLGMDVGFPTGGGKRLSLLKADYDVDFSTPGIGDVVGMVQPFAVAIAGQEGKLSSDLTGKIVNVVTSNAQTPEQIKTNVLSFAKTYGFTFDGLVGQFNRMVSEGRMSQPMYTAAVNSLKGLRTKR